MAQIKFYSLASMPTESIDANGLYFIDNGEIYKGAVRFGRGRVTTQETVPADAVRGDINVYGGVAKVFDGTAWQELGGTTPTFDTGDSDGQLKLGSVNATVSGWGTLAASVSANASSISDLESAVGAIESIVDVSNGGAVSASSGTFTNLTVTDTATFSVTTVSASSLTIGGSTVAEIADAQIAAISSSTATSTANGVTVSVTTQGGSVTAVAVNAASFGNVMHFAGVVSTPTEIATPAGGDIVVIGSQPDTGYVAGQEYIYDGTKWEVIGDQNTYALNTYAPGTEVVTAAAATLPDAVHAIAAAFDTLNTTVSGLASDLASVSTALDSLTSSFASLGTAAQASVANSVDTSATTLPTCSAVADYVGTELSSFTSSSEFAAAVSAAVASALTWQTA